jgi:energy-coupling factor transporter ATP-binding protein EcfA2
MTEFIEIRGARENNVRDVSLRIPKRKITILTGVSGSGKSSVVFDTIVAETQRQLYENSSLFIRSFPPPTTHSRNPKPSRTSAWLSRSTRTAWALALDGRTITDLAPQMDCRTHTTDGPPRSARRSMRAPGRRGPS